MIWKGLLELVRWANQEKTRQVGVLVEDWPRVGVPGEDWTRGVLEEEKIGVYSSTGHSMKTINNDQ